MKSSALSRLLFVIPGLLCIFTGVYALIVGNTKFGIAFIGIGVALTAAGHMAHSRLAQ